MRKKTHAQYAAMLLGAITFVANITAVTGLILSKFTEVVITAAVLVTLYGLYLFLRQWGKTVGWLAALAAVVMIAGSIMLALSLSAYHHEAPADTQNTTPSGDADNPAPTGRGGKPVKPASNHTKVFEKQFVLRPSDGLELDDEKGTIFAQQTAADAPIDIYLSDSAAFLYAFDTLYDYQPLDDSSGNTDKDQYAACASLLTESQQGQSSIYAGSIVPGAQYCLKTNRGRVALLTVTEMISQSGSNAKNSADIILKLWN
jgi:hypothetical protein